MEIPVTAGPWLVLGLVLGMLLPVLGALAVRARRRRPGTRAAAPPPPGPVVDDLPGFLESPPGSVPAPPLPDAGWPALSAPAPRPPATPVPPRDRSGSTGVLVAMAVTALLLIGAAAAVATARAPNPAGVGDRDARPERASTSPGPAPGSVSAELAFENVVLERHAVGVTVAAPTVRVTAADGRATAEVELETYNCLRDEAPEDPVAAGCSRSVTEYAQLSAPELAVRPDGDTLRVSGAFPTWREPFGSPPVATGRVYEFTVTAAPRDGRAGNGREAATGLLELGDERVGTRDDGASVITYGG
ncbi:hypothetical protein [Blastococcus colisei]|nr:hypothetical protein [Blastococcus colisei]